MVDSGLGCCRGMRRTVVWVVVGVCGGQWVVVGACGGQWFGLL